MPIEGIGEAGRAGSSGGQSGVEEWPDVEVQETTPGPAVTAARPADERVARGAPAATYAEAWFAERYREHWEPVLAPADLALLDRLEAAGFRPPPGARAVEIGAGTGFLSLEMARRWPDLTVVAAEPAPGMLQVLRERLSASPRPDAVEPVPARADSLPLADGAVALAVSCFVLQIVQSRPAAFAEVHRVLAPGAWLGYVTWLEREDDFAPPVVVDEALGDTTNADWSGGSPRAGDVPSLEAAEAELVAAGLAVVSVEEAEFRYEWDAAGYLRYVERCRNAPLFQELDEGERLALRERVQRALARLSPRDFVRRAPIVYALARRPG